MADAILVLNAGSSSLKFSVFLAQGDGAASHLLDGQVEGLYTSPRFVAKDAAGSVVSEQQLEGGPVDSATREPSRTCSTSSAAARATAPARRRRPPRGARRSRVLRADAGRRRGAGGAREARPARATAPAAQPRRRSGSCCEAHARRCRRWPASTPPSTASSPSWPRRFALPTAITDARRAPLRLPRAVVRVHRLRCCRGIDPRAAADGRSSRTWATAPACARCTPAGAWPAPWASPRWTACRWAPAAAPSTPA